MISKIVLVNREWAQWQQGSEDSKLTLGPEFQTQCSKFCHSRRVGSLFRFINRIWKLIPSQ